MAVQMHIVHDWEHVAHYYADSCLATEVVDVVLRMHWIGGYSIRGSGKQRGCVVRAEGRVVDEEDEVA